MDPTKGNTEAEKPAEPGVDSKLQKELEELKSKLDLLQKENESLKSHTNSITNEELEKMDKLADTINNEVSEVTLMTSEADANAEIQYDWNLLDQSLEAMKLVNECFDKVIPEENSAKLAVRKLRERMYMANTTIKKSVVIIQQKLQQAIADATKAEKPEKNEAENENINKMKAELENLLS